MTKIVMTRIVMKLALFMRNYITIEDNYQNDREPALRRNLRVDCFNLPKQRQQGKDVINNTFSGEYWRVYLSDLVFCKCKQFWLLSTLFGSPDKNLIHSVASLSSYLHSRCNNNQARRGRITNCIWSELKLMTQ